LRTKGNASQAKMTGSRATRESWAVSQSSHTAGRVGDAEFSWTRIVSNEAEFHTSRWGTHKAVSKSERRSGLAKGISGSGVGISVGLR